MPDDPSAVLSCPLFCPVPVCRLLTPRYQNLNVKRLETDRGTHVFRFAAMARLYFCGD
jgi:hypothetical protein